MIHIYRISIRFPANQHYPAHKRDYLFTDRAQAKVFAEEAHKGGVKAEIEIDYGYENAPEALRHAVEEIEAHNTPPKRVRKAGSK